MSTPLLSIIIPCRGNPSELWFTLQGLLMRPGMKDIEILVVDNSPEPLEKGDCADVAQAFGSPVRYVVGSAVQSPYHPRNVGADEATGEWLLFLDAHVLLDQMAIGMIKERINPAIGCLRYPPRSMVHFPVAFKDQRTWYGHYKLTLEKDFWGAWGPAARNMDIWGASPYQIAASGIWAFLTRRADFNEIGRFNENFLGYGGGEVYLHLKYWRMGGQVLLDPTIRGVHWSGPREYKTNWKDRIRNVGIGGRAVVGEEFLPRFMCSLVEHYVSKGVKKEQAQEWLAEGALVGADEGQWLDLSHKRTFDQVRELWKNENVLTS